MRQALALAGSERYALAGMANVAAFLAHEMADVNWAGFYFWSRNEQALVLGPFCGKVACTRIAMGQGVCGTALAKGQTLVVPDVHAFSGHIACDSDSESETVVPMFWRGEPIGVLDVDSPRKNRFSQQDAAAFEAIAARVLERAPQACLALGGL